jgi:hypothetical protein
MEMLAQQFRFVVPDLVNRWLGHAESDLRVVDEHRVVPVHAQFLPLLNTAARDQLQLRRIMLEVAIKIEVRVQ